MIAKPIRALELRYPMIQSLKTSVMCPYRLCLHVFRIFLKTHLFVSATLIRFLIRFDSGIVWILNQDIFLPGDVTRSSPVRYCEYCIQDGNLDACSVFNIPGAGY